MDRMLIENSRILQMLDDTKTALAAILKGVDTMTPEVKAVVDGIDAFKTNFDKFSTDTTTVLTDLAGKISAGTVDPTDAPALTAAASKLTAMNNALGDLDTAVLAADAPPAGGTPPTPQP
jgi:2-phospho-L-lactate guanylyltransferase (CobY/MobA/RfbA family)